MKGHHKIDERWSWKGSGLWEYHRMYNIVWLEKASLMARPVECGEGDLWWPYRSVFLVDRWQVSGRGWGGSLSFEKGE